MIEYKESNRILIFTNRYKMSNAELKRLEDMRLSESLRPFVTENDVSKVQATVAPAPPGMLDNLGAQLDALNLEPDQRALTQGLAIAIGTKNQRGKTLTLAEAPDPLEGAMLSRFDMDLEKESVADMIGTEIDPTAAQQRAFASYKFPSEAAKDQTLKDLLQLLFMRLQMPVSNVDAMRMYRDARDADTAQGYLKARRQRQMQAVITYMASINTAKVSRKYQDQISEAVQNDMVRKTTLTNVGGKQIITAPVLGKQSSAEPEVLRNLNTVMGNIPFGSSQNGKPLERYLRTVFGVINGVYSEKGAFQILSNVLTGPPHDLLATCESKGDSFESSWNHLQLVYNSYGESNEGVMAKITKCLSTRPSDATSTVGYLQQLVWKKNIHLDPSERNIIYNSEVKQVIFSFLNTWYPNQSSIIRQRFDEINQRAAIYGKTCQPADILLTQLIAEFVKNVFAIPERVAQMHALEAPGNEDLSVMACTSLANRQLAKGGADILAFGVNKQHQNGGFQKNTLEIPDHLRDRCLKCAASGHFAKTCPKYPNEGIGSTICEYCRGKHISRCKNIGVNAMHTLPALEHYNETNDDEDQDQIHYDGHHNQQ